MLIYVHARIENKEEKKKQIERRGEDGGVRGGGEDMRVRGRNIGEKEEESEDGGVRGRRVGEKEEEGEGEDINTALCK